MQNVLALLVIGLVAAVLLWPRSDFVIRARPDEVQLKGKLPQSKAAELICFFEQEVAQFGPVTVSGTRAREGRLRLRIRGRPVPGDQQRIRNFLLTEL